MDGCRQCDVEHPRGAPDCPARRLGQTLGGRYRLEHLIGMGGMGAVYEAVHVELGTHVAIKIIRSRVAPPAETVERFRREARELATLRHPGIVEVRDLGRDDGGIPYMVMELLEGECVADVLGRGPLPIEQAVRITIDVLDALAEAHARSLVHRDLKPANLFLQRSRAGEVVKVLDFGIAKVMGDGEATALTQTGLMIGSAPYMSPEQTRDSKRIDPRSDVYAMGATLFELLTGSLSVEGTTSVEVVVRIAKGEVQRHPRQLRPQVPVWLDEVVAKALATEPAERFQSALEMRRALELGSQGATLRGAAVAPPPSDAPAAAPASRPELDDTAAAATPPTVLAKPRSQPGGSAGAGAAVHTAPAARPAIDTHTPEPAVRPSRRPPEPSKRRGGGAGDRSRLGGRAAVAIGVGLAAIGTAAVLVAWPTPQGPRELPLPTLPERPLVPAMPVAQPPVVEHADAPTDAGVRGRAEPVVATTAAEPGLTPMAAPTPSPRPPRVPRRNDGAPRVATDPHPEEPDAAAAAAPPPPTPVRPPSLDRDEPLMPGNDPGLPQMPDHQEIIRLLWGARSQVHQCAPGRVVSVQFQIAGSTGHARQIRLPQFEGTPAEAQCVERALRRISFPRFRVLVYTVQHIFPR